MQILNKLTLFFIISLLFIKTSPIYSDEILSETEVSTNLEQKFTNTSDLKYLKKRLDYYHLTIKESPFNYEYKTEVLSNHQKESFELDQEIEGFAKSQNLRLNHSILFDADFITQPEKVREYLLKPKYFKQNVGHLMTVTTKDGLTLGCTYFDRGSDKLLVVGGGFTNERELMSPFVDMFADHDVILFDYRGHGYRKTKLSNPSTWPTSFGRLILGVNNSQAKCGREEEKDVFAVVKAMKKKKNYKQVSGLGICYSALIFAKAAALKEKLFDKLILDGCWLSSESFGEKLIEDPKKIVSPQYGGWSKNCLVKKLWFQDSLKAFAEWIFNGKFNCVSILDYLPHLTNIPVLYFYGKDDLVVTRKEFEIIWNATQTPEKTAVITSNPHVRNHLKQKELYKMICDLFLELPHNEFISCLMNKENLIKYEASKLKYIY